MTTDQWARWLLERRHGGDERRLQHTLEYLYPVRDRVLDHARLTGGETLLDIGSGDGLIAFGALERLPRGQVIFTDISRDLLDHTRVLAAEMNVLDRVRFVNTSADDLSPIDQSSVDCVTVRSVLIYVDRKREAFEAFYRVLKPGGRLSLFEPINRFGYPEPPDRFWGYDIKAVNGLAQKVRAVYEAIQPPDTDPMLNFDERDLMNLAYRVGFREVYLHLDASIRANRPAVSNTGWEDFIQVAPNPRIPTLQEAMEGALTAEEREQFTAYLRPLVETTSGEGRSSVAYLWAVK